MRLSGRYEYVRRLLLDRSGIVVTDAKDYLIEARLGALARELGLPSVDTLVGRLPGSERLRCLTVEAMTTNETYFFRDVHPFEAMRTHIIPALIDAREGARRLNIWCAACSSGQEPYSFLMMLFENFPALREWDVRVLATDLSEEMLERTRAGRYTDAETERGLPLHLRRRYFEATGDGWQISAELRDRLDVRAVNLTRAWPSVEPMDIVLMRNVLIYFEPKMRCDILRRVRSTIREDGWFFLGSTESAREARDVLRQVTLGATRCYQPTPRRDPLR